MKIKLKKGLDLKIAGGVDDLKIHESSVSLFAVYPDDFPGFKPKVDVKEGDEILAASPIMHHKDQPAIKLVSPVCGRVKAVIRGERRKVIRVEIEASADNPANGRRFDTAVADSDAAMRLLAESGLLAEIRQRPYDIVPVGMDHPRDIFVTAIDSAPLAVSPELFVLDRQKVLAEAVAFLRHICAGKIYICVADDSRLDTVPGAEMVTVTGPFPSGNAGIQAANISPVNKGELIWTMDVATLARIGSLVSTGLRDCTTLVAITGPELVAPRLASTCEGASVSQLLKDNLKDSGHHIRIISGNVLTGVAETPDGFLHFPFRQLTVIAEGDDKAEFMGWASFSPSKQSVSPTFPGHFLRRSFVPDARLNGGRRSIIMSGEYDRVMPMDILPEYLIKAIISRNIDAMEKLGIYEVAPEDFAAAEYVDTSKLPLQQIVRDGLDYLRQEVE